MAPYPLTPRTPRMPRQTTLSFPGALWEVGKLSTDDIAGCHTVISAWTPLSPVTPSTIKLPIRTLQSRLQFRVTKAGVKRTPASKDKLAETPLLTPPGSNSPAHSPLVSSPPTSPLPSTLGESSLEESTPDSAPGMASTPLSGSGKRTVDFGPLYRTSHGRHLLRRKPFNQLQARALKAHRREELKRILDNEPRFFTLLDNGATPFLGSTRPAKCNDQRLSLFASLPNEILVKIFSILLQRKIPDHVRRHFYRRDREQARRQYLRLHAGYFGNVHTSPNPSLDSVWPLMQTCHKLRNCVQYHVAGSTHIRVNILDLPAFVEDIVYSPTENLCQARFASIHVFVPAGLFPPIPIHPFLPLARAGIPVKLEFDKKQLYCNTAAKTTQDRLDRRALLEHTIQTLVDWTGSKYRDGGAQLEAIDTIFVHPNCELYVAPSPKYIEGHSLPGEWSGRSRRYSMFARWEPGWRATASKLRADFEMLHTLTNFPVWLDISVPWRRSLPYDKPFPDYPYRETEGCRTLKEILDCGKGPCVKRILIGDPYGYRIHPTAEFFSSTQSHDLRCLTIPVTLNNSRFFLGLFTGVEKEADEEGRKRPRREYTPNDDMENTCCSCSTEIVEEDKGRRKRQRRGSMLIDDVEITSCWIETESVGEDDDHHMSNVYLSDEEDMWARTKDQMKHIVPKQFNFETGAESSSDVSISEAEDEGSTQYSEDGLEESSDASFSSEDDDDMEWDYLSEP